MFLNKSLRTPYANAARVRTRFFPAGYIYKAIAEGGICRRPIKKYGRSQAGPSRYKTVGQAAGKTFSEIIKGTGAS
jgi:hypothetical protein